MDFIVIMGATGSLVFMGMLLLIAVSSSVLYGRIFYPNAAREFIKLKREIRAGKVTAICSSAGACCTRCTFIYSSGRFETHMDASMGPLGHYSIKATTLNLKESEMQWLGEKSHSLAQRKRLKLLKRGLRGERL